MAQLRKSEALEEASRTRCGRRVSSYRLGDLADRIGARLSGDPDIVIDGIAPLAEAGPRAVTFLSNRRYRSNLGRTRAGAVILAPEFEGECPVPALVLDDPYLGYARTATLLSPPVESTPGIAASAVVDPGASVATDASIGPHCVVEAGASVGEGTTVAAGSFLGRDSSVGPHGRIENRVVICPGVSIGARAIIHAGVVIGADGFGIANDDGVWLKIPQLGGVRIGDDVEIGANTTIDRGALGDTVIEDGVKLDNLIQIGHNVHVGAHTAIAACVAIGGSARIGRRCTIMGAVSIAGHLEIADDVQLTATSAVPNSIRSSGIYSSGMPIQENRAWRRNVARLRQLDDMARRLRSLERRIDEST